MSRAHGRVTASAVGEVGTAYPFFDAALLRDLVGSDVTADRLRHKPGVSTTATLTDRDGRPWGWAQVLAGGQDGKIANARRRASERGETLTVRSLGRHAVAMRAVSTGPAWFVCGRVGSDPRLHRARDVIAALLSAGAAGGAGDPGALDAAIESGEVRVLRYNALRRLVLRGGAAGPIGADRVLRLTAAHQPLDRSALRAVAGLGVPIAAPLKDPSVPTGRRVTLWPWVAGVDLAAAPDVPAARAAGAALAALHAVTSLTMGERIAARLPLGEDPDRAVQRVVDLVAALAPGLERRVRSAASQLPGGPVSPTAIVHGDFSADQVVRAGDQVRLVDLDRLHLGSPGEDLGSFAAAELRRTGGIGLTGSLVQGYASPGSAVEDGTTALGPHDLTAWTAYGLMLRLAEPFRAASPSWLEEIEQRLDEIERVRTEGVAL